ncbi:hypothetical protein [Paenibacillus sp. Soil522]|uniref:hypothetical protein n=1 Tax=Paenibacillus sp. Soil522 TaxID=1736388 RepID=UPI0006F2604C|nr:hypothetical protein [Paenibacillus sp. Soil522]KRE33503.1 hypothetical protein ASG81_23435 [Paenibacillus sp. Soil522]
MSFELRVGRNAKSDAIQGLAYIFVKMLAVPQHGPEHLTIEYINSSRYFMFDLLDDFVDAMNHEEAIITLNTLSVQLIDFILRLNGQWSGRGKTLSRGLNKLDTEMCKRFFMALDCFYKWNNKKQIIEFVNEVYKPIGGQLFAGFSMGKKSNL